MVLLRIFPYFITFSPQPLYATGILVIVLPIMIGVVIIGSCTLFFVYRRYRHGYWCDKEEGNKPAEIPQNTQSNNSSKLVDNTRLDLSPQQPATNSI